MRGMGTWIGPAITSMAFSRDRLDADRELFTNRPSSLVMSADDGGRICSRRRLRRDDGVSGARTPLELRGVGQPRRPDRRGPSLEERLPGRSPAPFGSWFDAVVLQNPLHRISGDRVSEVGERATDPGVAPPRILHGHPHSEIGEPTCRHRSASTSPGTAIGLLGDQHPVPAQNRVGCDDAGHLSQSAASEPLAAYCESATLGVGEPRTAAAELLPENPILLSQVLDQVFLVAV